MKCVFCGTENDDNNFFCLTCGRRIGPVLYQDSTQARNFQKISERDIHTVCGHIDLSTPEGVEAIPLNADIYWCTFHGRNVRMSTYLRSLGYDYEKDSNPEMAIACLKKSNEIRMTCREGHNKDEYYSLVRMLARLGFVAEAQKAKAEIDDYFSACGSDNDFYRSYEIEIKQTLYSANYHETDLVIMEAMVLPVQSVPNTKGACFRCMAETLAFQGSRPNSGYTDEFTQDAHIRFGPSFMVSVGMICPILCKSRRYQILCIPEIL